MAAGGFSIAHGESGLGRVSHKANKKICAREVTNRAVGVRRKSGV